MDSGSTGGSCCSSQRPGEVRVHELCTMSMEWLMLGLESEIRLMRLAMGFLHTIEPGVDLRCIKKQWRQ